MRLAFSKKWMINMVLAGLAVFLAFQAHDAWLRKAAVAPDDGPGAKLPAFEEAKVARKDPVPAGAYDLVVEKNLFALERREILPPPPPPAETEKPAEEKPAEKPALTPAEAQAIGRLSLVGIVLSEDRKTALIRGGKGKGRGGGLQWVVVGDEVEGMRVTEILDEKVLLTSGDAGVEIPLYDPGKPKQRAPVQKEAQPTVVSTGGGADAGAAPPGGKAAAPQKTVKPPARAAAAQAPALKLRELRKKNPT